MLNVRAVTPSPDEGSSTHYSQVVRRAVVGLPVNHRNPSALPGPAGRPHSHQLTLVGDCDAVDTLEGSGVNQLTPLEWTVVQMSLGDPLQPNGVSSSGSRFLGNLLGRRQPNKLADPRLEALRVFAIHYRYKSILSAAEAEAISLNTGLSAAKIEMVQRYLDQIALVER